MESPKLIIKNPINIDDINKLIISYESNNPIPIKYYSKNLIHIKNKAICKSCSKLALYKYNELYYCWSHAHSLI